MSVYKVRTKKSPWVWYSGAALCEKFPYMSQRSIERWMRELEEANELVSRVKNKNKYDKTKSYTTPEFTKIPILIDSQTGDEYIVSMDAQNGESNEKNGESTAHSGEPIPPLSSSDTPQEDTNSSSFLLQAEDEKQTASPVWDSERPVDDDGQVIPETKKKKQLVVKEAVHEWVAIWNRYPNWKATGRSGTPRNLSVSQVLLKPAEQTTDILGAILKKRTKYSLEEFELAVKNYAAEVCNRVKDTNGFYLQRYSLYEFLTHKNIFERYVNK